MKPRPPIAWRARADRRWPKQPQPVAWMALPAAENSEPAQHELAMHAANTWATANAAGCEPQRFGHDVVAVYQAALSPAVFSAPESASVVAAPIASQCSSHSLSSAKCRQA